MTLVRSPTMTGRIVVVDLEVVDARERASARRGARRARLHALRPRSAMAADVRRRGAAAAADHVEPALLDEARAARGRASPASRGSGRSRRAGRRWARRPPGSGVSSRQRAEVVGHELGAGGAVEAEVEQVQVLERGRERLDRLARRASCPSARWCRRRRSGTRRPACANARSHAEQRRLDVARVLAGLDQQVVDAALDAGPRPAPRSCRSAPRR